MISIYVLDSWPVLEWIRGRQPASRLFSELLVSRTKGDATLAMSRINHGEVIYSLQKAPELPDRAEALAIFRSLSLEVHSVDDALVDAAVEFKSRYSISYADAFAAALAIRLGAPLVTGDPEFQTLAADGAVQLYWVGA